MWLLISCIVVFWIILVLLDIFLKCAMFGPYLKLLEGGLNVSPGSLQWHTKAWNQAFRNCRRWRPAFQDCWFTLGSIGTCALVPVATFILIKTVFSFLFAESSSVLVSEQILQPVLPGANVPLSDAAYYFLTLLFCSAIHEVGHALCAAREDVQVCGVGFFLMVIFPGAFVELSTDHVNQSTPCQRLRIFCAGVWHNLVLVLISLAALWLSPALLTLAYSQGQGLLVVHVEPSSGLMNSAGLSVGDILLNVSDCRVSSLSDWTSCLFHENPNVNRGYCVSDHVLSGTVHHRKDAGDCCSPTDATGLCFVLDDSQLSQQCLPVRKLLESEPARCDSAQNCSAAEVCAKPLLYNNSQLLQLQRLNKRPVLFLGSPHFLIQSVRLSSFIPKYYFVPASLPSILETQLKYLIAFSSALAVLNVVPCYGLDGYYIFSAFLHFLGIFPRHREKQLIKLVTVFGTLLLATNVACGISALIKR